MCNTSACAAQNRPSGTKSEPCICNADKLRSFRTLEQAPGMRLTSLIVSVLSLCVAGQSEIFVAPWKRRAASIETANGC